MRKANCHNCHKVIDTEDSFCRHCGLPLADSKSDWNRNTTQTRLGDMGVITVAESEIIPAVQSDLQALKPAAVRAVGVLAAASFLEWAVRRGIRDLLESGLGIRDHRIRKKQEKSRTGSETEIETVVIQQKVSLKR